MPGPTTLDKKKTAVLVMDFQIDILKGFPSEFQSALIMRTNKLMDTARQYGLPIIFTQRKEGTQEAELDARLIRKPGEVVLTKRKRAPFASTDIDERLKKLGVTTIIVMGIHTSSTVLSTVRCGSEIDYKFFIVSDCCADRDEDVQAFLFEKVFYHTSTVLYSKALFELLAKS